MEPILIRSLMNMEDFKTLPCRMFINGADYWPKHHVHVALRSAGRLLITRMSRSLVNENQYIDESHSISSQMVGSLISATCDVSFRMDSGLNILSECTIREQRYHGLETHLYRKSIFSIIPLVKDREILRMYLSNRLRNSDTQITTTLGRVNLLAIAVGDCFHVGLRIVKAPAVLTELERQLALDIHYLLLSETREVTVYRPYCPDMYLESVLSLVPAAMQSRFMRHHSEGNLHACTEILGRTELLEPGYAGTISNESMLLDIWFVFVSMISAVKSGESAVIALEQLDQALVNMTTTLDSHIVSILMTEHALTLMSAAIQFGLQYFQIDSIR